MNATILIILIVCRACLSLPLFLPLWFLSTPSILLFHYIYIYIYILDSFIYSFCSHKRVCFQLDAFVREYVYDKALLMLYLISFQLTRFCSLNGFLLVMGFRETWVQSQITSLKKKTFKKRYLIPPCLTLSNIRYVSRVKRSSQEKGVAPSPTPRWSSYRKGSLLVALDCGQHLIIWSLWWVFMKVAPLFFFFIECVFLLSTLLLQ